MPSREQVLRVVREWVKKAEQDMQAAVHMLSLGVVATTDIVCFHAQQCIEKYLKSVLVLNQIPVPKTHDIEQILSLIPDSDRFPMTTSEMRTMTAYAVDTRYPASEEISLEDARKAVALAERIRNAVREILPPEIDKPKQL
ncbi:MAG: HEPN domain-containing protein [Candidatus Latescibacter sp.]|nr:HEPN domain-containing protein [Candidatus Latescibacter sp.]